MGSSVQVPVQTTLTRMPNIKLTYFDLRASLNLVASSLPMEVFSTRIREFLLHGTLQVPGLLQSLPHHSASCLYCSGEMRSSASQWPVQDLLLVRLDLLGTPAWSRHRWMRSLMLSKTSSTQG